MRKHLVNDANPSDSSGVDEGTTSLHSDVPCEYAHSLRCTIHQGKPIDTHCKDHDEICCGALERDWKERGIQFCFDQSFEKHVLEMKSFGRLDYHIDTEYQECFDVKEYQARFHSKVDVKQSHDSDTQIFDVCLMNTNDLLLTDYGNRLSYLVASEICSHLKKKNRVKLVEYFIDVAKECINIGNFNSLMAIIAGMNMNPVARLKKTWAKVNKAKFGILELQMDPSNNFGSYRSCLKAAMWRSQGANDTREKIVIPFFSLFVKDIYFLNEGHANRAENGNINFEKFWQLAKHISDFVTWQQVECPFEKHTDVLHYILTSPVFSETTLSLASFECEPPENSYDKERHKKLKAEAGL